MGAFLIVVIFCDCCCEFFDYSSATEVFLSYSLLGIDYFIFRLIDVSALGVVKELESVDDYGN